MRTRETAPLEYANTISNKANCLWNLPDDPEHPEAWQSRQSDAGARAYYGEARAIFMAHGELDKARIVAEAVDQIEREILSLPPTNGDGARMNRHRERSPNGGSSHGDTYLIAALLALVVGSSRRSSAARSAASPIGGKAIGNELAGDDGRFYGRLAGVAGLVIGLVVLALIH